MDKKTLALLGVALIVVGVTGLVLSSGYSHFSYGDIRRNGVALEKWVQAV